MKASHIMGAIITLLIVAIFLMTSAGPVATTMPGPQVSSFTASKGIQPYATMNTNITWSDFNSGWAWNEYNNGTSNLTLNTGLSTFFSNPITVNPADIVAPGILQGDKLGVNGNYWNKTTSTSKDTPGNGAVSSIASQTYNGQPDIVFSENTTKAGIASSYADFNVAVTSYPSNNLAYDYITLIYGFSGATITGVNNFIYMQNQTTSAQLANTEITPGQYEYITISMAQIAKETGVTFNTSGKGQSNKLQIQDVISLPQTSNAQTYTSTIYGVAISEIPYTIGTSMVKGSQKTLNNNTGMLKLNNLAPNFKFSAIENGGYTVATTQPLQNVTTTQTAIQSGSYIEEVQKQGKFALPSSPSLTYGPANISEKINVSSSQVMVLDINGLSYLSTISGKNGTVDLLSSASPTQSTSFLEIVEYTSSQWNTISGPPGFFSVAGVEYYFDEIVLGLTALLGIGGAAAHRRAAQLRRVK